MVPHPPLRPAPHLKADFIPADLMDCIVGWFEVTICGLKRGGQGGWSMLSALIADPNNLKILTRSHHPAFPNGLGEVANVAGHQILGLVLDDRYINVEILGVTVPSRT